MAGEHIVQATSQAWANAGSQAEYNLDRGWLLDQAINSTGGFATSVTVSSGARFLSTGNGTTGTGNSFYTVGRLVRVVHGGGTAYALVSAASTNASSETAVTLTGFSTIGTTSLSTSSITSAAVSPMYAGTAPNIPFATNAITLSTAASSGTANTLLRSDAAIAAFDATSPASITLGSTSVVGSVAFAARRDHAHGLTFNYLVAVKTADESVNNSTSLQNDDHLTINLGSSQRWAVEMFLHITQGALNAGLTFDFSAPANTAGSYLARNYQSLGANDLNPSDNVLGSTDLTVDAVWDTQFQSTSANPNMMNVWATVNTSGTTGSLTFRWAQRAGVANNTTIHANSWMKAVRLA